MNRRPVSFTRYLTLAAIVMATIVVGPSAIRSRAQETKTKMLSHKDLMELIQNAKEPADHEKLAAYYRAKAEEAKAGVAEHQEMLDAYAKNPASHMPAKAVGGPTAMCQTLIRIYGQEEKADLSLAEYHEKMAKEAASAK